MPAVDPGPHVSLERMNRFQEPDARRIIGELGLPAGPRGLDVGCGVGLHALWLAGAVRCAIGSWGGRRPSLAGYVTLTGPSGPAKGGAPAAGCRSWCLAS